MQRSAGKREDSMFGKWLVSPPIASNRARLSGLLTTRDVSNWAGWSWGLTKVVGVDGLSRMTQPLSTKLLVASPYQFVLPGWPELGQGNSSSSYFLSLLKDNISK